MRNASNSDIPEEIQVEILSRLPPKLLSRFKCVSKHWNDTLTLQAFLLSQARLYDNKRPEVGFVVRSNIWGKYSFISFELNDDNTPKTTPVTGRNSYTNASLIRGHDVYFTDFHMTNYSYMSNICKDLVCLFNPSSTCVGLLNVRTRDFISLPAITIKSVDQFWYALGFDPVHKVFKVVSMSYRSDIKEYTTSKAAILTIGQSKYWKSIDNGSLPSSVVKKLPSWITTDSLCLDGVIYWVPKNGINKVIVLTTVVAFDLNREVFRHYELDTTPMKDMTFRYYLTCLKECPTLFIWKMKREDIDEVEQWTLFNHKNPNSAWSKRNLANHNFPILVPYSFRGVTVAGGSTLLKYWGSPINSEWSWYSWYDLANFAIE